MGSHTLLLNAGFFQVPAWREKYLLQRDLLQVRVQLYSWCSRQNSLATHVPLLIRTPNIKLSSGTTDAMVEVVDLFPTLSDLAGVPPLDPTVKGEPPLEGRSLRPIFEALSVERAAPAALEATSKEVANDFVYRCVMCGWSWRVNQVYSFSQYGRARCYSDLFETSCQPAEKGYFMGYSVRNASFRYTRWVNISTAAPFNPQWEQVYGEELYSHVQDQGDDYDDQENENLAYHTDPQSQSVLSALREVLKAKYKP